MGQEMLHDAEFMKQSTEGLRNPVHVRDVLCSTDHSMSALDNLAGGAFDVLRQMCEDIRRPTDGQEPVRPKAKKSATRASIGASSGPQAVGDAGEDGQEGGADADATGAPEAADLNMPQPPEWMGTFDTNAMASMMQDQNMQHLLAQ